ncbi:MAG: phage terminase large subunit [bacterium]|nr:phage terminase large subunit [bacterium]
MLTEKEEIEYLRLLEDEDYYQCKKSLVYFVRTAWDVIEPGTQYIHNWHIDMICEYLTAVAQGDIKRLIINIPFRHMKSILVSVMFPCWGWIHKPTSRWLFASYAQDLSTELSVKRRRIIQSEWYQRKWGGKEKITTDINIKTWFANSSEGSMRATSVGGSVTGVGGDVLICDDACKTEDAMSTVKRTFANDWFDATFTTRLNNREESSIIVIMHRLHVDDLTGHLVKKKLEGEYRYQVLSLPLVERSHRILSFPISGKQIERHEGEILWTSRDNALTVRTIRESLGTSGYMAQCQQDPVAAEGNMVKREWWRYYRDLPASWVYKYQSLDTAIETKKHNDYSVCITAVEAVNGYYITDIWRQKVEAPDLERAAKQLYDREKPNVMLIERKASGYGLIQHLKRETSIPLVAVDVDTDKGSRLDAILAMIEAGRVYLPEGAAWVADFVDEMSSFPSGAHDDQVDALTQLLGYARHRGQSQEAEVSSIGWDTADLMQMI